MHALPTNVRGPQPAPDSVGLAALRWTARLLSLAAIALLALFAFGPLERARPAASEWVLLAFFPIGVALGMIIAWWREMLGGIVSIASLATFYAIMLATSGNVRGPYFLLFTAPSFLFLLYGLASRRARSGTA